MKMVVGNGERHYPFFSKKILYLGHGILATFLAFSVLAAGARCFDGTHQGVRLGVVGLPKEKYKIKKYNNKIKNNKISHEFAFLVQL